MEGEAQGRDEYIGEYELGHEQGSYCFSEPHIRWLGHKLNGRHDVYIFSRQYIYIGLEFSTLTKITTKSINKPLPYLDSISLLFLLYNCVYAWYI